MRIKKNEDMIKSIKGSSIKTSGQMGEGGTNVDDRGSKKSVFLSDVFDGWPLT